MIVELTHRVKKVSVTETEKDIEGRISKTILLQFYSSKKNIPTFFLSISRNYTFEHLSMCSKKNIAKLRSKCRFKD